MAFTPITGGIDMFQVDLLNEIVQGLQERVAVSTGSPPASVVAGTTDVQDVDFWNELQTIVETICTSFYDSSVVAGGYEGETSIAAFTESYFFNTVLGMTETGYWRRATAYDPVGGDDWTDYADDMFSYGKMQAGDIIGPWILDDLQKTLKKLLWTQVALSSTSRYNANYRTEAVSCASARTGVINGYDANVWSAPTGVPPYYLVHAAVEFTVANDWGATSTRIALTETSTSEAPTGMTAKVDVYEKFEKPGASGDLPTPTFVDLDSLGITTADGEFAYLLSPMDYDDSGVLTRTGGELGYYATGNNPLTDSGIVCTAGGNKGCQITEVVWIARWAFTNVS